MTDIVRYDVTQNALELQMYGFKDRAALGKVLIRPP